MLLLLFLIYGRWACVEYCFFLYCSLDPKPHHFTHNVMICWLHTPTSGCFPMHRGAAPLPCAASPAAAQQQADTAGSSCCHLSQRPSRQHLPASKHASSSTAPPSLHACSCRPCCCCSAQGKKSARWQRRAHARRRRSSCCCCQRETAAVLPLPPSRLLSWQQHLPAHTHSSHRQTQITGSSRVSLAHSSSTSHEAEAERAHTYVAPSHQSLPGKATHHHLVL